MPILDLISDPATWLSLAALTALEIVLGIDNIIFLSLVTARLPDNKRKIAQRLGLLAALIMRIALLTGIVWIIQLKAPLFEIFGQQVSWRDLILISGGLFLLANGTREIHEAVEVQTHEDGPIKVGFIAIIAQIMLLDMVFSLDSIITAIAMTEHLPIMITAVVIAILVMMLAAGPVSGFINRHPSTKMLALSFLLLIGVALLADGLHFHIPRGYLYFAILFSIMVEMLNLWASRNRRRKRQKGL